MSIVFMNLHMKPPRPPATLFKRTSGEIKSMFFQHKCLECIFCANIMMMLTTVVILNSRHWKSLFNNAQFSARPQFFGMRGATIRMK